MSGKVAKRSVGYRQAGASAKRCGTCAMFRPKTGGPTGSCTLVQGFIRASDTCDRWAAK